MYFFGMPNNNAEYIQAYSRTGRKFTGIVVDIIRLMRVRDRSYLKNFVIFHQNRDDLVEAVPINRWAKNAIYSTLPGLLAGLIRQYYTIKTNSDSLHNAIKVQKLLRSGEIDVDDAVSKLIAAYGCNEQEKMSLAYKEIITEEAVNISQRKIVEWLYENNIISEEQLPDLDDDISVKKWFAQYVHSDVISMFGEIDDSEKITKNVFALLHSMSHAFMNSAGELSGLSGNSLTEIILVETASIT